MALRSPAKRSSYHHGDLRNALIEAALQVLADEGNAPEVLTLREVSRRVGVNHRAAYRHFKDKVALFAAVAEQGYRQLLADMEAAIAEHPRGPSERRLRAVAAAYVAYAIDHPSHYRIMFGRRLNEDGRFPVLEELVERAYQLLADEIRAGQKRKELIETPVREAVFGFWSLAHGFSSLTLVRRIKVKRSLLESWGQLVFAPFFAGMRHP